MVDLSHIFDGIEKLAYDILIWILLVPKTLVKILVHPSWVPGYVTKELNEKTEAEKFDDYLSPILLILIASLLPLVYIFITPAPSVAIDQITPAALDTNMDFSSTADFISDTGQFTYVWTAEENDSQTWQHDQLTDYAAFKWSSPGWKKVDVVATNQKNETLKNEYYVYIPQPGEGAAVAQDSSGTSSKSGKVDALKTLEGPEMVLPALIFLSLPMLFAIATEALRGYALMRSTLMRSFYIQCYYFAPFILVFWSFYLGLIYFITPLEFGFGLAVLAAPVFILIWLIWNETKVLYSERGMKSRWGAFGIVSVCIAVIVVAGFVVLVLLRNPELFREFLEWFYVLAAIGLFVRWLVLRRQPKATNSE